MQSFHFHYCSPSNLNEQKRNFHLQIEKISPQLTSFSIGSRTQIQILASVTTWFKGKKKADARSIVEQFLFGQNVELDFVKDYFFLVEK